MFQLKIKYFYYQINSKTCFDTNLIAVKTSLKLSQSLHVLPTLYIRGSNPIFQDVLNAITILAFEKPCLICQNLK